MTTSKIKLDKQLDILNKHNILKEYGITNAIKAIKSESKIGCINDMLCAFYDFENRILRRNK